MLYKDRETKLERAVREFDRDFNNLLNTVVGTPFSKLPKADQEAWLKRDAELHPSSFPYCGLRDAYERLQRRATDFLVYRKFDDDFYLNVGTVAHSALQLWLGEGRKILGNWRCLACKKNHPVQIKPRKCIKCRGKRFQYDEIGGKSLRNIYWHSDGLFLDSNGRYFVIDYKTSSVSAIQKHRDYLNGKEPEPKFPYKSNKIQIETYCVLLEQKLGIKIYGWMLKYVSRDYPRFYNQTVAERFTDERRELVTKHLKVSDKMFPLALEATKIEQFKPLKEHKLCSSKRYYKEAIHDDWSPCPIYKVCFKPEKLESTLEKEIKLYRRRKAEAE